MHYWIDLTETLATGAHSGIQRVAREITSRLLAGKTAIPSRKVNVVIAVDGRFYILNKDGLAASQARSMPPSAAPSAGAVKWLKKLLSLSPALYARMRDRMFNARLRHLAAKWADPTPAPIAAGDVVLLIDTYWNGASTLAASRVAKQAGASIFPVIYDLIPVLHPGSAVRQLRHDFTRAVRQSLRLADGILTISRAVRDDVLGFSRHTVPEDRILHFHLGCDFEASPAHSRGGEEEWARLIPPGGPIFLMIGTIEPRKRHEVALAAFEQLWDQGSDARLVIIGRPGWLVDDLLDRCRKHPLLGRQLFLIHNASDPLVRTAIEAADAAIMTSTLEGFGLPVVEALSAGLPVLASDIPVFREIADGAALFFTPGQPAALADAVRTFILDRSKYESAARHYRWLTWDEAAVEFAEAACMLLARAQGQSSDLLPSRPSR